MSTGLWKLKNLLRKQPAANERKENKKIGLFSKPGETDPEPEKYKKK